MLIFFQRHINITFFDFNNKKYRNSDKIILYSNDRMSEVLGN